MGFNPSTTLRIMLHVTPVLVSVASLPHSVVRIRASLKHSDVLQSSAPMTTTTCRVNSTPTGPISSRRDRHGSASDKGHGRRSTPVCSVWPCDAPWPNSVQMSRAWLRWRPPAPLRDRRGARCSLGAPSGYMLISTASSWLAPRLHRLRASHNSRVTNYPWPGRGLPPLVPVGIAE